MKKYFRLFAIVIFFTFIVNGCNKENSIDSSWNYSGGEDPVETIILYKNGTIVFKNNNKIINRKGLWKYSDNGKVLIITADKSLEEWDVSVFKGNIEYQKKYTVVFNETEKVFGLDIKYSNYSKKEYIDYFGSYFYRINN